LSIGYYFVIRANVQLYILEGFEWRLLLTFATPLLVLAVAGILFVLFAFTTALIRIKAKEPIWPLKKWFFILCLLALSIGAPFIPVKYSSHASIRGSDKLEKDFFRTVELEHSGLTNLSRELYLILFPRKQIRYTLTPEEQTQVNDNHLDDQTQKNLSQPYRKIILIVLESFNQQFLSKYNDQIPGTTPNLDRFFSEYPHLDAFYPSGSFTLHGLASMLCGHTNLKRSETDPKLECAPKLLSQAGYKTEFIRGATKYYVEENVRFKKFGYQSITAKEELAKKYPEFKTTHKPLYKSWGYTDNYVLKEMTDRLKAAKPKDKLFLTALTLDTHVPGGRCYREPTPEDPEDPILFSAKCFDEYFSQFLKNLENEGLMTDDTAIILTADHPYPAYNTVPGNDFRPSFVLTPSRIPFLLVTKKKLPLVAQQGSHVDIAATLLNLANLSTPTSYLGKSLVSNSYASPVGQDRENGYLIANGHFFPLSLNPELQDLNQHEKGQGIYLELLTDDPREIDALIQAKVDEKVQLASQEQAFFNWYYNKYFNVEP